MRAVRRLRHGLEQPRPHRVVACSKRSLVSAALVFARSRLLPSLMLSCAHRVEAADENGCRRQPPLSIQPSRTLRIASNTSSSESGLESVDIRSGGRTARAGGAVRRAPRPGDAARGAVSSASAGCQSRTQKLTSICRPCHQAHDERDRSSRSRQEVNSGRYYPCPHTK